MAGLHTNAKPLAQPMKPSALNDVHRQSLVRQTDVAERSVYCFSFYLGMQEMILVANSSAVVISFIKRAEDQSANQVIM